MQHYQSAEHQARNPEQTYFPPPGDQVAADGRARVDVPAVGVGHERAPGDGGADGGEFEAVEEVVVGFGCFAFSRFRFWAFFGLTVGLPAGSLSVPGAVLRCSWGTHVELFEAGVNRLTLVTELAFAVGAASRSASPHFTLNGPKPVV